MPSAMEAASASASFSAVVKVMIVSRMIRFQISAIPGHLRDGRAGSKGDLSRGRVENGAHAGRVGGDDGGCAYRR
jgi:hypothetical protein